MIETESKPKLPKFAAWPVGRQRLAGVAEGMAHLDGARVRFSDYIVTRFVSDPKHRSQPYPLVSLEFTRQWNPDGEWTFRVYPIPSERAPRIRALVNEQLLPRLRKWLEEHDEPAPNATRPRLRFASYYNEHEDHLQYDER